MKIFERITKYILSICTVLTLVSVNTKQVEASSTYKQLTSGASINSGFEFANGINTSISYDKVAVFEDSGELVHNSHRNVLKGTPVTVKIPNGFKYLDGSTYDVYVQISVDSNITGNTWVCKRGDSGSSHYMEISPFDLTNWSSDPYIGFNYEIWLKDPSDGSNPIQTKGIQITAGSCYTAPNEGARPWGDDGKIYTNIPKNKLEYKTSVNGHTTNCWHTTDWNYNKPNYYILGNGTDSNYHFHGGYVRSNASGSAEMVLGYFLSFNGDNYEGYYDGNAHTITVNTDSSDAKVTYYSDKEGTQVISKPSYTDVEYDAQGNVVTHEVYYRVTGKGYTDNSVHTGTVKIKPRPITVKLTAYDKVYDGTATVDKVNPINNVSTGVKDETYSVTASGYVYGDNNKDVGTYTVKWPDNKTATLSNSKPNNYVFYYVNGSASITKKTVYVNPLAQSREYKEGDVSATILGTDNSTEISSSNTISVTGCIQDESLTVYGLTGTFADDAVGLNKPVTIDSSNMTVIEGSNTKQSNYKIIVNNTYANIYKAGQNISVTSYVGVYDGYVHNIKISNKDGQYISDITYYSDSSCTTQLTDFTGYTDVTTENNGMHLIYFKAKDVNTEYEDFIGGGFVMIIPKPIEVTLTADDKVYDGTTTATINDVTNVSTGVGSEKISVTGATGNFDTKDVGDNKSITTLGTRQITYSDGAKEINYTVTVHEPTASITPKPITVTLTAHDKVYDGTTDVEVDSVSNVSTGILNETYSVTASGYAFPSKDVGDYTISWPTNKTATVDGGDANNYVFTFVDGSAKITKKTVYVYPTAQSREYTSDTDTAVTLLGGDYTNQLSETNPLKANGCVSGESLTVYNLTGTFADGKVGYNKLVTVDSSSKTVVEGANTKESNYEIVVKDTYANIYKAGQNISVTSYVGVYDGKAHNITIVNKDGSQFIKEIKYYSDADCTQELNDFSGYTDVTTENNGMYLVYFKAKDVNSEYEDFIGGGFVMIVPRPIEVTLTANDKVYDGTTSATVNDVTNQSTGVLSETISVTGATGEFVDPIVGENKTINTLGTRQITYGEGTKEVNYSVTVKNPTASITPRPITVTADSLTIYKGDTPTFTYKIDETALVQGDSLTGGIDSIIEAYCSEDYSKVGSYPIGVRGQNTNSNYIVTYVPGTLTVLDKPSTDGGNEGNDHNCKTNYTWSDSKQACVYKVTNTSQK